jgi:hypothetical protein
MPKKVKDTIIFDFRLPQPSTADLRGRQSVRATFKLTSRAIEAMSIASIHLGIKQKSLFDHLIDDIQALKLIAQEVTEKDFPREDRVQKTFVLSRKTLSALDDVSKRFDAPRDALVEFSIQRLMPVIAKEREKHEKRKAMLEEITAYLKQGEKVLQRTYQQLGEEDEVFERFQHAMSIFMKEYENIHHFVSKGDVIESFFPSLE